jgi:hypothetical protein
VVLVVVNNLRSHVRYLDRSLLNGCHSVWQKLIDNPMMPSPFGHMCKQLSNYQIKLGAKHGRWLYWGNKNQFPHLGVFAWLESGGGLGLFASGARVHQIAVVTV